MSSILACTNQPTKTQPMDCTYSSVPADYSLEWDRRHTLERKARQSAAAAKFHREEAQRIHSAQVSSGLYKAAMAFMECLARDFSRAIMRSAERGIPVPRPPGSIRVEHIQAAVCAKYEVALKDVLGTSRLKDIVRARQVGMYLCRVLTSRSLPEIGRRFGSKDHSTVLWAVHKIDAKIGGSMPWLDKYEKPTLDLLLAAEVAQLRSWIESGIRP